MVSDGRAESLPPENRSKDIGPFSSGLSRGLWLTCPLTKPGFRLGWIEVWAAKLVPKIMGFKLAILSRRKVKVTDDVRKIRNMEEL
jgi:hypothetical protein